MGTHTPGPSRRSFLFTVAAGAGALAAPSVLAGCESDSAKKTGGTSTSELAKILPAYVPSTLVPPDIPSANGSDPGYLKYPTDQITTVPEAPGAGGSYTAITPLWGAIPSAKGNKYYEAMNAAFGASLAMKPANGNTYGDVLPTLFTGDKLPDWIDIPSWNTTNLNFGSAVEAKFVDLTPFLSGDNVKKYPNLANVPSNAWQAGVWNGKLFGIPVYPSNVVLAGAIFYRQDMFEKAGIAEPKSADELFEAGKALTDPKKKVWGFDDLWTYLAQPFDIPFKWAIDSSDKLVHKYETEEIIQALEFMRKIVAAELIHPDALAGNTNETKQRFTSGKIAMYGDGTGAWGGMVEQQDLAGDTVFKMQAMQPFTASGTGTPRYALGNGASMFSYLNKKLNKAQIEECLRLANYIAAPFGSAEYTLVNFGPADVTHTMEANGPKLTKTGEKQVATTYQFLATAPSVTSKPGYEDWVRTYCDWHAKAGATAYKPVFYGMNITEPQQYSSIGQPVEDTITDVCRNRKSIDDFKKAVDTWRRNGGDALRDFYTGIREQYGTGQ
ncbi:MAG: extracellular solute-binding protein [Actinomycetales bacterium]|nr:extracellular solute-binding protein [Actinomycetales bacterium]